ncbi:hypothetical protein HOH87_06965 [bacterium]|jgi:hypothetical protein|nr:hypothetical protein [bacterium]
MAFKVLAVPVSVFPFVQANETVSYSGKCMAVAIGLSKWALEGRVDRHNYGSIPNDPQFKAMVGSINTDYSATLVNQPKGKPGPLVSDKMASTLGVHLDRKDKPVDCRVKEAHIEDGRMERSLSRAVDGIRTELEGNSTSVLVLYYSPVIVFPGLNKSIPNYDIKYAHAYSIGVQRGDVLLGDSNASDLVLIETQDQFDSQLKERVSDFLKSENSVLAGYEVISVSRATPHSFRYNPGGKENPKDRNRAAQLSLFDGGSTPKRIVRKGLTENGGDSLRKNRYSDPVPDPDPVPKKGQLSLF